MTLGEGGEEKLNRKEFSFIEHSDECRKRMILTMIGSGVDPARILMAL